MINNVGDLKSEFIVRNQASTLTAFYTDTIIGDWLNQAYRFTTSYKKWPFTEGKISTTYTGVSDDTGYTYPEGWKSDSIRHLEVGGKRFRKMNFYDYRGFREDNNEDSEKIFSDFGRTYYINPKSDASGTITAWGQYMPVIDITDDTATTVFSGSEEEGNEAIINEMISYAKTREKKAAEAKHYHEKAVEILEGIWKRIMDEQAMYQGRKDAGMFENFDVLRGDLSDDLIRRDRWY